MVSLPWPYNVDAEGRSSQRDYVISLAKNCWAYESPFPDYDALQDATPRRDLYSDLRIAYGEGCEELERDMRAFGSDWSPRQSDDGVSFCTDPQTNLSFPEYDAFVLYCMVRRFRPSRIIEIGSGMSTRVTVEALIKDAIPCNFLSIDRHLSEQAKAPLARRGVDLRLQDVTEVGLEEFDALGPGDILFIDSSHVLKNFGDVEYEYMKVLPRLRPGVVVHVHDIFLPYNYPLTWIVDWRCVLTEQQLLAAFLHDNARVKILSANFYNILNGLCQIDSISNPDGGSFWFQMTA